MATSENVSNVIVVTCTVIGSVLLGIGAALIWVIQGKYMSDCVQKCPERAGQYTGLFFTIVGSS